MLSEAMPIAEELIDQIMSSINEADAVKLGHMLEVLSNNAYSALEKIARDS